MLRKQILITRWNTISSQKNGEDTVCFTDEKKREYMSTKGVIVDFQLLKIYGS